MHQTADVAYANRLMNVFGEFHRSTAARQVTVKKTIIYMKEDHSHTFTTAFRKFLTKEKIDTRYREKLLVESWEDIMGKPIASRTSSIFLKGRILFIKLSSAPLKQELVNQKEKVRALVDQDFGDLIDDIRFL